jgi:ankyrin repeat protein
MAEEIFEAIARGDAERVRALAEETPALAHRRNDDGTSALLLARYYDRLDMVDALAEHASDLDVFEAAALGRVERVGELLDAEPALTRAYAPDGFHPLGLAAFFRQPDVVRLLLDRGAEVDAIACNERIHTTALQAAAASGDNESARLLIDAGADVNTAQPGGFTPLHAAAANGNRELVELLLERGADPGARLDDGRTPVELVPESGQPTIAALLTA